MYRKIFKGAHPTQDLQTPVLIWQPNLYVHLMVAVECARWSVECAMFRERQLQGRGMRDLDTNANVPTSKQQEREIQDAHINANAKTSKRPGRKRAWSIMSFLLVMPITSRLFGESTPIDLCNGVVEILHAHDTNDK